jgi:uncharacterized protein (TIGR00369 family)
VDRISEVVLSAESLNDILQEFSQNAGIMSVTGITARGVTVRLAADERHGRPGGTLSGPAQMALADAAAWFAIMSRVGPKLLSVTTSLHIDFVRKPEIAALIADAELVKLGQRLAVVRVTLCNEGATEACAVAQVTYSIPRD